MSRRRVYVFSDIREPIEESLTFVDEGAETPRWVAQFILWASAPCTEMQKQCFELFYVEQLGYTEIAKFYGISSNGVKKHVKTARQKIQNYYKLLAKKAGS